jgi:hypothetical protein
MVRHPTVVLKEVYANLTGWTGTNGGFGGVAGRVGGEDFDDVFPKFAVEERFRFGSPAIPVEPSG